MALTALDFPASPTNGQLYPDPPVTGQPQYAWNGTQWLSSKAAVTQIARTDALGWSGMQINGSMEVSQEKGTAPTSIDGSYILDMWRLNFGGTMAVTVTPAAGTTLFKGLPNYLVLQVVTAQTTLTGSNHTMLSQKIEGYRIRRLGWGAANAQPITVGFWTAHHRTGIYSGSIINGANNRSYTFTYTQAGVDIPQFNTVTIPGDTTGTWAGDNSVGLVLNFVVACGPTLIAPSANTWAATGYIAAPGQINGVAATNDEFRLTGVVVLPGIEAPTAAQSPLIMRPYDQELVTCQRYFQRCNTPSGLSHAPAFGYAMSATQAFVLLDYLAEMRATPTLLANIGNWVIQDQINAPHAVSSLSINTASTQSVMFLVGSTGLTTGAPCRLQASPSAGILSLDARL